MSASIRWGVPQAPIEDGAGSAIGDATASAVGASFADGVGSCVGDATCSGTIEDTGNPLAAAAPRSLLGFWMGGAEAPQTPVVFEDGAGSCEGDATCSGAGETIADCAGTAEGDATCDGSIEDATPVVVTPPAPAIETFGGAWGKPVRKPKKKQKKLLDLDELIAELKTRIVEIPEPLPDIERTLRVSQAIAYNSDNASFQEINNQIALLREAIEEIDDEEVIMLLAA
jgi:hypothetical protein